MKEYSFKEIEKKWQKKWDEEGGFKAEDFSEKEKYYALVEFPYPSGSGLHLGHCFNYALIDFLARKKRMDGYNVMCPIGWDAFGLPAENYAIKMGIHPSITVKENTDNFRKQMKSLGFGFNWDREVDTTDPSYYKWTQWIFKKLFEHGLVYKKKMKINWCPSCKIGLANEEVVDGSCERCGAQADKRNLDQWLIKITAYADRLADDLDLVDFDESIVLAQRNWIGRSEGAKIGFQVDHPIKNAVVVHGKGASPDSGWKPWLADMLQSNNIEATVPTFPSSKTTKLNDWISVLDSQDINKDTVLIGHSRGTMAILRWLEQSSDDQKVGRVVLVAPNYHHQPNRSDSDDFYSAPLDFDKLKQRCEDFIVLHSKDDESVEYAAGVEISNELGAKLYSFDRLGHFSSSMSESPEILDAILPSINVFTTRPDTLFGATFLVLAPEHPMVDVVTTDDKRDKVRKYIEESASKMDLERKLLDREKTGVFTGGYALNPLNNERVPIFVADYVLIDYGEGALMGVPAHDERDNIFAKKYNLEIREVVSGEGDVYTGHGKMINSGKFDGLDSTEGFKKIVEELVSLKKGERSVDYHLRDWIFSRQHYWGEPIPMVYCDDCAKKEVTYWDTSDVKPMFDVPAGLEGWFPVADEELPVELPSVEKYEPTDTGESPLAAIDEWVNTKCPHCGSDAKRETDTMPNWAGSSWYFLRYCDNDNDDRIAGEKELKYWMPTDIYVGGAEHTTLHLLYSRFWHKFLYDIGLVHTKEPYAKRRNRGLVLGEDNRKMSKSKGNYILPEEIVSKYGADALRVYLAFIGPYDGTFPWQDTSIKGVKRFLDRLYSWVVDRVDDDITASSPLVHKLVKEVGDDWDKMKFNTSVAKIMKFLNEAEELRISREDLVKIVAVVSPLAPHMAEELWSLMDNTDSVHTLLWPTYDPNMLIQENVQIVIQVNGKVRDRVDVQSGLDKGEIEKLAAERDRVKELLKDKETEEVFFVPDKLINIVTK